MRFNPHAPILNRESGHPFNEGAIDLSRLDDVTRKRAVEALREIVGEAKPLTMGTLVIRGLDAAYADEKDLKAEEKYKRFILGTKIAGVKPGEIIDLSIEEAKTIKDVVAKAFVVGLWGQIWTALDDAASPKRAAKRNGQDAAGPPHVGSAD